jgi:aryl-alcohol dehydrogenase-like predicted oxidoreductase
MGKHFSRREFLQSSLAVAAFAGIGSNGATAANAPATAALPKRVLGKTGVQVPLLGLGTAQAGLARSIEDGVQVFQKALELGINYFDSAPESGGYGKAQIQLGHAFKDRRKDVFLTTKCAKARADEALKMLEANLKEMQTDYADLVYVHSLGADEMDMNVVTGPGGVMEFLQKVKRDGLARFVGVTGHNRPDRFLPILNDFDMLAATEGAAEKKVGLVAMKVFGGSLGSSQHDSKLPAEHHQLALRYALEIPNLSCAVIGMKTVEEVERNVDWVKQYKPLTEQERAQLNDFGKTMAAAWKDHLGKVV